MQCPPCWAWPHWCVHGVRHRLHHCHGAVQVWAILDLQMHSVPKGLKLCSVLQHLKRLCWIHLYDVSTSGKNRCCFFLHYFEASWPINAPFQSADCAIWRRPDCCVSDGRPAWPWPGQWGLPLQLLCHAHIVLLPLNAKLIVHNCWTSSDTMIVEISSEGLLPPKWFRRDKKRWKLGEKGKWQSSWCSSLTNVKTQPFQSL